MHPTLLLLLVGLLYILAFGALAYFRREGLSLRFAYEALALTLLACALSLAGVNIPAGALFLVAPLRRRRCACACSWTWCNFDARQGRFPFANASMPWRRGSRPDAANRLIVRVNQGTARLQQGALDARPFAAFKEVLQEAGAGHLVLNTRPRTLGTWAAHRRERLRALAVGEFRRVLDVWPVSECARRARGLA